MSSFFHKLIFAGVLLTLATISSVSAEPPGFLEGHLKVISPSEVQLADETSPATSAENYAEYPLIILSQGGKKEIARITADANGRYRLALPPGDYILDVEGRRPKGHVRAKPQRFTVVPNQIARVDMDVDTGVR